VLAINYAESGHPDDGLHLLNGQRGDAGFSTPEIHRLKGTLTLQIEPTATDRAECCFRDAIADARRRHEKSLELRAAMDLYRLKHRLGDDKDARRSLAELYDFFTEGFATADLVAAKALLA
jgi:hypothetical protein